MKILAIAGSLRKTSYNKFLLQEALALLPSHAHMEVFDLASLPLFNQDEEAHLPSSVLQFKEKIEKADALLIATPEYNYSFSGVLKNALDWGSRPSGKNSWNNKPCAIMGASMGSFGTVRAQHHLRQVLMALNVQTLLRPEVMVGSAHEQFDAEGKLKDPKIRDKIKELLLKLCQKQ